MPDSPAPVGGLDAVLSNPSSFTVTVLESPPAGPAINLGWVACAVQWPRPSPDLLTVLPLLGCGVQRMVVMYPQHLPLQTEGCLLGIPANSMMPRLHEKTRNVRKRIPWKQPSTMDLELDDSPAPHHGASCVPH